MGDRSGLFSVDLSSGSSAGPARLNKRTDFKLLAPSLVPLSDEQRREAVVLLADLLLAAEARSRERRSVGVIDSASGGAIGSVIPLPDKRRKGREAG
jgi:hypothetical protein